jgi:hypothetical protein
MIRIPHSFLTSCERCLHASSSSQTLDEEILTHHLIYILASSHGQAGSERGFADNKRIVMDRAALSDRSVKGLKTEAVKNFGGASLLHDVKQAHILKMQEEKRRKEKKGEERRRKENRIEEETEDVEAQALAKRKKEETEAK